MQPSLSINCQQAIIEHTQSWLEKIVIGLNLCPFAKAVYSKNLIRYTVSLAQDEAALRKDLIAELQLLNAADPDVIDTTLLIHPQVCECFYAYNNFLRVADGVLAKLGLVGTIQLASFHPQYQFADAELNAIDNFTNRSPYPMLHLLREQSIDKALKSFPNPELIYQRNIATLYQLGHAGLNTLMSSK